MGEDAATAPEADQRLSKLKPFMLKNLAMGFIEADVASDRPLSFHEFKNFFPEQSKVGAPEEVLLELFRSADTNSDGRITQDDARRRVSIIL